MFKSSLLEIYTACDAQLCLCIENFVEDRADLSKTWLWMPRTVLVQVTGVEKCQWWCHWCECLRKQMDFVQLRCQHRNVAL